MMYEEKKEYSIIGKVEIGTDEYRDLIEGLAKARADYSEAISERWELRTDLESAKKEAQAYKEDCAIYLEFINSSEELKAKFKAFRLEKRLAMEDEQ